VFPTHRKTFLRARRQTQIFVAMMARNPVGIYCDKFRFLP